MNVWEAVVSALKAEKIEYVFNKEKHVGKFHFYFCSDVHIPQAV